jgi:choline kinase
MGQAVRNIASIRRNRKIPPYEIIIPAAGVGKRMTYCGAKPLIPLTDKLTVLQHQVNVIRDTLSYNPQIILVTGFQSKKVMDNSPENFILIENERFDTTNVARSIGMGLRASTTDHVIIIYGDLVFNKFALKFPIGQESLVVIDTNFKPSEEYVGCTINNGYVEHMFFGLPKKWAQVMMLTGRELELAKQICWSVKGHSLFGFEVINAIIKKGGKIRAVQPYKIQSIDIDSVKDIVLARQII